MPSPALGEDVAVRVGIDVGGTFTDLVVLRDDRLVTAKVPSTPADQSAGVSAVLAAAGLDSEHRDARCTARPSPRTRCSSGAGAHVALVTTDGFRDLLEIARQNRPSLYDLTVDRPPPLVPRELRFTVHERMAPGGVVQPLDEPSLSETVDALRAADVQAVAVCLLFSYLHPAHEQRVGEALGHALPGVHVSLSCLVLPEFREYERTLDDGRERLPRPAVDAYLRPAPAASRW